jgi:tungstate transport system substrate-binding protein
MSAGFPPPDRRERSADVRSHPDARRRCLALALLVLLSAAALLVVPGPASADTSSTLTVVGASDMSDSGLFPNLIQPEFKHLYPQFALKYIAPATGESFASATSGSVGASAMILHAPSLENQLVARGYSYERYGRAILSDDYVLAGSQGDPAGVLANARHNIAKAFADIAAAGFNGGATTRITFVSSGGTPGTTVEEHSIWQLVQSSGLAPAGLLLCALNASNGGGLTPIAAGNGVTASGQPCPGAGALPAPAALPAWYVTTGDGTGANVQTADACNAFLSGPRSCYVLTDRGTYDYLASRAGPAVSIPKLEIVTRGPQSVSSPGGADALIDYFHAYIVDPLRQGEAVNLTAAQDFVNFLTSPAFQARLRTYLAHAGDPGGAPFVADASPVITASGIPRVYHAGRKVTVTGVVSTAERGYPALGGETVNVDEIAAGRTITVATGTTSALGRYGITFAPTSTGSYAVATPQIAQIENAALNPPFGDLLSPATGSAVAVSVQSTISNLRVKSAGGKAVVIGSVAPGTGHIDPIVQVYARQIGSRSGFTKVAAAHPATDDGNFAVAPSLAAHRWQFRVTFRDPRRVVAATSRTVTATIGPPPSTSVNVRSLKVSPRGALTITGNLQPNPAAGGASVELLGLDTSSGKPARFGVFVRTTVPAGKAKFTLRAHLRHGNRYVVQLEYVNVGQASSFSRLRTASAE